MLWEIRKLDFSSFDCKNVKDMSYMLFECKILTNLELSSFDPTYINNMSHMLCGFKDLEKIDLSSILITKVTIWNIYFVAVII